MSKEKNVEKVIKAAEAELGYHEKASKKDLDSKKGNAGAKNYTKYAEWFDTKAKDFYNTKKNPAPWCDIFVDFIFCECFGEATARLMLYQPKMSLGAGCKYSAGYYRSNKAFYSEPALGDQIFFGTKGAEEHTGIVVKITEKTVTTIEGNAENEVRSKTYQKTNKKISGYGRPNWAAADKKEEKPKETKPKDEKPQEKPSAAPVTPSKPSNVKTITASRKPEKTAEKYAKSYKVTASALNMRDGAGKGNKVLVVIPNGKIATCGGSYSTAAGETWLFVTYEKTDKTTGARTVYEGFCCSKYLR